MTGCGGGIEIQTLLPGVPMQVGLSHSKGMRLFFGMGILAITACASAQWSDVKRIAVGGQPMVVSDDKGGVYLASQQPCELRISRDWGDTWTEMHAFSQGVSDMTLAVWGSGRVHLAYTVAGVLGIRSHYSFDSGKTMRDGGRIDGGFDRARVAPNLSSGEVHLVYSDGYIGGPTSKGVFAVRSSDYGRTFSKPNRVDVEAEGSQAVDPHLISTPSGKLYVTWGITKDSNRIAGLGFAHSSDNGKTWKGHTSVATFKQDGDTQSRWMQSGLLSVGEDRVVVYYHDYSEVDVDGLKYRPLLLWMRVSEDGGASFSTAVPVVSMDEIRAGIKSHTSNLVEGAPYGTYIQTLPWMAVDGDGGLHLALVDNRSGQVSVDGKAMTRWGVRYHHMPKGSREFGPSEQVSQPFAAVRPPLDSIGLAVDSKHVYVSWPENSNSVLEADYSGELYVGRKVRG